MASVSSPTSDRGLRPKTAQDHGRNMASHGVKASANLTQTELKTIAGKGSFHRISVQSRPPAPEKSTGCSDASRRHLEEESLPRWEITRYSLNGLVVCITTGVREAVCGTAIAGVLPTGTSSLDDTTTSEEAAAFCAIPNRSAQNRTYFVPADEHAAQNQPKSAGCRDVSRSFPTEASSTRVGDGKTLLRETAVGVSETVHGTAIGCTLSRTGWWTRH